MGALSCHSCAGAFYGNQDAYPCDSCRDGGAAVDSEPYEKCGEGNRVALRISVTSFIAIVVLGLAWQLCGYTQDKPKASSKVPGADSNVSCYDESGRLVGPNKMRTFVLESPDGTYRAGCHAQKEECNGGRVCGM
jgi:hypothetical protein